MNMITPQWPAPKRVKAYVSTRMGGCSQGKYRGLNLGDHVGDAPEHVLANRRQITAQLDMPAPAVWLNQTHSTCVAELTAPTTDVIDADASVTQTPGVVCCVMTADCLPILLTDRHGTQVAAVHAGWRGLADGIVENALAHFSADVMAWIGPAISPKAFEVGADVRQIFCQHSADAEQAFVARSGIEGKWLADLPQLAAQRLKACGVQDIYQSNLCTYADSSRFYSYRRDGITGRFASFIWLDPTA